MNQPDHHDHDPDHDTESAMSETETGRHAPPSPSREGAPPPETGRRMTASELLDEFSAAQTGSGQTGSGQTGAGQPGSGARAGDAVPGTAEVATPAAVATAGAGGADEPPAGAAQAGKVRLGDRVFRSLATTSGVFIVLVIAAVAAFLLIRALPAITGDQVNFLFSREWNVQAGRFGVAALLWVTVVSSLIAMLIAVPVGVGIALFITMYAPARLAGPLARVIDLLAAIPSIVYGIWGLLVFGPAIQPVANFLSSALGFIPLFADKNVQTRTIFTAGVVLAIMILPIITAVSRDVFERTPRANIEASLALGATRWEMIRMAVLPYGRAGVTSGAMLGLGRALGETIAVTLILSTVGGGVFSFSIFTGGETFASKIANNAAEFNEPTATGAYIAAGLVLFILTFVVNAVARVVVSRGEKK